MADGIDGAEKRFELFSGVEEGFGPIRHDGRTPRTSPLLPGMEVEAVDGEDITPFYERGMSREEENEILAGVDGQILL